jgi:hypothetical protein
MAPCTARQWRTASTTFPVPASPFVRIMDAPSAMRRSASPRSRQPHTKGTLNLCLFVWCTSSAGVSTCSEWRRWIPCYYRVYGAHAGFFLFAARTR